MLERLLTSVAYAPKWGRQMRFIAGPRQSGKTTLAKAFLDSQGDGRFYYNWDNRETKARHNRELDFLRPDLLASALKKKRWVCFDEIHKMPLWKNILKSYFDTHEERVRFIITGSARLDLFRRSGDSLAGRYFLFHLLPLTLFELTTKRPAELKPIQSAEKFIENRLASTIAAHQTTMESLLNFGGFPEPFLASDSSFLQRWQEDYVDRLVKEDLRDLTRIPHLENAAHLLTLLPGRTGSPLSVNSLRGDLEVSHETIRNYLQALKLCYVVFELSTYTMKINRAIRKEKKVYFFDWARVTEPSKRFENFIATQLYSWVALWSDEGLGTFELAYVRNRAGQECDFLIVRDKKPWLLIEAKSADQPLASHLYHFSEKLGGIPIIQLTQEPNILRAGGNKDYRISASRFLSA